MLKKNKTTSLMKRVVTVPVGQVLDDGGRVGQLAQVAHLGRSQLELDGVDVVLTGHHQEGPAADRLARSVVRLEGVAVGAPETVSRRVENQLECCRTSGKCTRSGRSPWC